MPIRFPSPSSATNVPINERHVTTPLNPKQISRSTGRTRTKPTRFKLAIKSTKLSLFSKANETRNRLFIPTPPESIISQFSSNLFLELANPQASAEDSDSSNRKLVLTFYEALNARDSDTVVKIVAPDLEWWFHGPPSHQFLMRMLTGDDADSDSSSSFRFVPQSVASFYGSTVIVEGCDTARAISWVHALTVSDGVITQVREYFNTSLTVTRFGSSEIVPAATVSGGSFPCVWESSVSDRVGKSVPGLVLAI